MSPILLWHCSPRRKGITSHMVECFGKGARESGALVESIFIGDHAVQACTGCNACLNPPHICVLDKPGDEAEYLFAKLVRAKLNVFAAPVYFYSLPAHFKAWIDRAQRYWNMRNGQSSDGNIDAAPALALMAAGRKKGDLLFDGGVRTLSYFLKLFNLKLEETVTWRGLENLEDLIYDPDKEKILIDLGRKWGKKLI